MDIQSLIHNIDSHTVWLNCCQILHFQKRQASVRNLLENQVAYLLRRWIPYLGGSGQALPVAGRAVQVAGPGGRVAGPRWLVDVAGWPPGPAGGVPANSVRPGVCPLIPARAH